MLEIKMHYGTSPNIAVSYLTYIEYLVYIVNIFILYLPFFFVSYNKITNILDLMIVFTWHLNLYEN